MKTFKRFMSIFGICFGALIGFIGIVIAIYAITGGFTPKPVDITSMSFISSNGSAPGKEIESIHIIDNFTTRIFYDPSSATEKAINLTVVGDGAKVIELSSTTVNAGSEFVIKPKKKTIIVDGKETQVNVGGEAQIIAVTQNGYTSCKLFVTVDVEVPVGGLNIVGVDGGEYRETGYRLNRVGNGLFQFAVQTYPSNALQPNSGQYTEAESLGFKQTFLTLPEGSAFTLVGDPQTKVSYYSQQAKKYFAYDSYKTLVTKNDDDTYSLLDGGKTYTDLVITQHYIYTLRISEDIKNDDYAVTAKVFKTFDIQKDFLAMQAGFSSHSVPEGEAEYKTFNEFVAKYKKYIMAEEAGVTFLQGVTNNVGDIQINTVDGFNTAVRFLQVSTSINFILEDIDIISMRATTQALSFDLHSSTYTDGRVTYNLNNLTKEDLVKMFDLSLTIVGSSEPISKWVGDVHVLSLKNLGVNPSWNDIIAVTDGGLSLQDDSYDNSKALKVTYNEGSYNISVLDEFERDATCVLLFATKSKKTGETFTEQYEFAIVNISGINVNLAQNIKINTQTATGGIDTAMVTNANWVNEKKEQSLFGSDIIQLGKGVNEDAPLTYSEVKLFASATNLFVDGNTAYPKIKLGSNTPVKYVMRNATDNSYVQAYELPVDADGHYYIRALNNDGDQAVSIFAAVVKTDINGDVVYKQLDENSSAYIFVNKSSEISVEIKTHAEGDDIRWYVQNAGIYYEKGIAINKELKLLLNETYDLYTTLYELDEDGQVVVPTNLEEGVAYLHNMQYAMEEFWNNSRTTTSFSNNDNCLIVKTVPTLSTVSTVTDPNYNIQAVRVQIEPVKTTSAATSGAQRRFYINKYPTKSIEFAVSKIAISNLQVVVGNGTDQAVLEDTHVKRPAVISKEYIGQQFVWGVVSPELSNPNSFTYSYVTDIDHVADGEWSNKIDEAFRSDSLIALYKQHLQEAIEGGEDASVVWSVSNSVATINANGTGFAVNGGSFDGMAFTVSCTVDTYKNNGGVAGSDHLIKEEYFIAREYPIEIIMNSAVTGTVVGTSESSKIVSNSTTYRQEINANAMFSTIINNPSALYVADEEGNVIGINVFNELFKGSQYSLVAGDILSISGNAEFVGGGKTLTIDNNILTNKQIVINLTSLTDEALQFTLTKKITNIYSPEMKEGYLVKIVGGNASFRIGPNTYSSIVVTREMVEAKTIEARLNDGASSTNIQVEVYRPEMKLSEIEGFNFVALALNTCEYVNINIQNAYFVHKDGSTHTAIIFNKSKINLEDYTLKFNYNHGTQEIAASIDYYCFQGTDGETPEPNTTEISLKVSFDNAGTSESSKTFKADSVILSKTYSYKTTTLIDVTYNGVSLLEGQQGGFPDGSTNNRTLNFNGITFTVSNNFEWVADGFDYKVYYIGAETVVALEITVTINGQSRVYYATYKQA